jgi:hypothetical protein
LHTARRLWTGSPNLILGLDLKDKSTWTEEHLPVMVNGGMIMNYCAAHEKWVWEARWCVTSCYCTSYEADFSSIVRKVSPSPFAELWGTDELLVSFDAVNITSPRPGPT